MSPYQRILLSQANWATRVASEGVFWVFPLTVGAGWLLWPALDHEWLMSMGLATDPEAEMLAVQNAKEARMMAAKASKMPPMPKVPPAALKALTVPQIEEEDETEDSEESETTEEVADGDEEENSGDEEEGETIVVKPLFLPTKGEKLSSRDMWDNFTIKAVKMREDDDDDDEEEAEQDESQDEEE